MRTYALAIATAALFALPTSAFSQGVVFGPGGVRIEPGYHHGYYQGRSAYRGECRELRLACIHKEELGEQGLGNCRRYREVCGGR
jgi:hypothetical protein